MLKTVERQYLFPVAAVCVQREREKTQRRILKWVKDIFALFSDFSALQTSK